MPASIGVNLRVTGHCSQGGRKYMEDFFSVAYQQSLSDEQDLEYAFIGIYDGEFAANSTRKTFGCPQWGISNSNFDQKLRENQLFLMISYTHPFYALPR